MTTGPSFEKSAPSPVFATKFGYVIWYAFCIFTSVATIVLLINYN